MCVLLSDFPMSEGSSMSHAAGSSLFENELNSKQIPLKTHTVVPVSLFSKWQVFKALTLQYLSNCW